MCSFETSDFLRNTRRYKPQDRSSRLLVNVTQQGLAASIARLIFKQHDGLYTEVVEIG